MLTPQKTTIELGEVKMLAGGEQQQFGTGSVRDTQSSKIRYSLISPIFMRLLASWCTLGAQKYAPRNWERGQPLHQYVESMMRHIQAFLLCDWSESHLIAAAWNIMAYLHTEHQCLNGKLPEQLLTAGENQRYTEEEYENWAREQILKKEQWDKDFKQKT